jgi:hypothetical protein
MMESKKVLVKKRKKVTISYAGEGYAVVEK